MQRSSKNKNLFKKLPDELVHKITTEVNIKDFAKWSLLCRRFNILSKDYLSNSPLSLLKLMCTADNIAAIVDRLRESPVYKKIEDDKNKDLTLTHYQTIVFALLTNDIYRIDAKQLDQAIAFTTTNIKSGQIPKKIEILLNGLRFTQLALNDRGYFSSYGQNLMDFNKRSNFIQLFFRNYYVNLSNVNFSHSNLECGFFSNINLENACLAYTNQSRSNFTGANIRNTNFYQAELSNATMVKAINLDSVNFITPELNKELLTSVSDCIFGSGKSLHRKNKTESKLRRAIANNIADLAWNIAKTDKTKGLNLLNMAIGHNIFVIEKTSLRFFDTYGRAFASTKSQTILQNMKDKIENLNVALQKINSL